MGMSRRPHCTFHFGGTRLAHLPGKPKLFPCTARETAGWIEVLHDDRLWHLPPCHVHAFTAISSPPPQPRKLDHLPKMVSLPMRELPALPADSPDQFFPYGLVGLVFALIMLFLFLTFHAWRRSRYLGANRTTTGRGYRSSTMSADTVSSLFPDRNHNRPIRPLPKRRLRERLSPDIAGSIQYPPAPQTTTPLFYYPSYNSRDDESEPTPRVTRDSRPPLLGPGRNGLGPDTDDEASRMSRIASLAITMSDSMSRSTRSSAKQDKAKHPSSQGPRSATSSVDGFYDPHEMTNNKKKRKIPTAGDASLNGSHIHDSMHGPESPGTPIQSIEGHGEASSPMPSSYYGPGFASNSHNVSGPGRGRYGRVRNGRSPLRALSDSSGNWAGRNGKQRPAQWVSPASK